MLGNLLLAEDRILTYALRLLPATGNLVRTLPGAVFHTQPQLTLAGLMGQRRRWINGGFFGFVFLLQTLFGTTGGFTQASRMPLGPRLVRRAARGGRWGGRRGKAGRCLAPPPCSLNPPSPLPPLPSSWAC